MPEPQTMKRHRAYSRDRCEGCGRYLALEEEVMLGVVRYTVTKGAPEVDVLGNTCKAYRYDPVFICMKCWDDLEQELVERLADTPPCIHQESLLTCNFCRSSILLFEYYARMMTGEILRAPQEPRGQVSYTFHPFETGRALCLACMARVTSEILQIWEDVTQTGECGDCEQQRCWRGVRPCFCACHKPAPEENR